MYFLCFCTFIPLLLSLLASVRPPPTRFLLSTPSALLALLLPCVFSILSPILLCTTPPSDVFHAALAGGKGECLRWGTASSRDCWLVVAVALQGREEAIAHTVTAQRSSARVEGLKPGTGYVVQVRARTVAGYGRYSNPADFSTNLESAYAIPPPCSGPSFACDS